MPLPGCRVVLEVVLTETPVYDMTRTETGAIGVPSLGYARELAIPTFTNQIARHMTEQGISQSDLARRLGVSRARVSQLLQHRSSPTLRTMVEVADVLGCNVVPRVRPRNSRRARLLAAGER